MPLKRVKDGKVIEEYGTKQPTAEQAQKSKLKEIAEQNAKAQAAATKIPAEAMATETKKPAAS